MFYCCARRGGGGRSFSHEGTQRSQKGGQDCGWLRAGRVGGGRSEDLPLLLNLPLLAALIAWGQAWFIGVGGGAKPVGVLAAKERKDRKRQ